MPVLVNAKACINRDNCFAADACPYDAYFHNNLKKTWEVDATICGDCPGPCLNFCDQDALRWGDDLIDLKLVKAELDGTMTPAQVSEARLKHKKEVEAAKAAEAQAQAQAKAQADKKAASEEVFAITRRNFEQDVLRSPVPVVVDCWAAWCGPCKQFSPVFEATAKQYAGVVKFAKLDTEAEPELAAGLGVQALPTVLLFYKGQIANGAEGAMPAAQFQSWLYMTLAYVRQNEAEFSSQAEEAITAAAQRLSVLNGARDGAAAGGEEGTEAPPASRSSGVVLDPGGPTAPGGRDRGLPGKQTPSGLYIP